MAKVIYIPDLDFFEQFLDDECKQFIISKERSLVRFEDDKQKKAFLDAINNIEFVDKKRVEDIIKDVDPKILRQINDAPFNLESVDYALSRLFSEIDTEVIQGADFIKVIIELFNHTIRKNEITFIAIGFADGSLEYDTKYPWHKNQAFLFQLRKLNFSLDTYYSFYSKLQSSFTHAFLTKIRFGEQKISDKEFEFLKRCLNENAKRLSSFKLQLETIEQEIKEQVITLKRTGFFKKEKLPNNFLETIEESLSKLSDKKEMINKEIESIYESKIVLSEELKKRHHIISRETVNKLLSTNKFTQWLRR